MIRPLTSLRFFAAMLVFAFHLPLTKYVAGHYETGPRGVEFFFVLSGFILAYSHREFFGDRVAWPSVKVFWVARFARIYPVHVLAFCFAMVIVLLFNGSSWMMTNPWSNLAALVTQATLTQSWFVIPSLVNFNGVAWSISTETFFYAVFPVAAFLLFAMGRRFGTRGLLIVAITLWAISFTLPLFVHRVYSYPPARLIDFLIGACFGIIFDAQPKAATSSISRGVLVLVLGLAGLLATPLIPYLWNITAWPAPFSVAIIYVFASSTGAIAKLVSWEPFVYLGEVSYNFYMLHSLILVLVFHGYSIGLNSVPRNILGLVLCLAVSILVFELYEKPWRGRIRAAFMHRSLRLVA